MSFERTWGIETTYRLAYLATGLLVLLLLLGLSWWIHRPRGPVWYRLHTVLAAVLALSNGVALRELWNQYHLRLTPDGVTKGTLVGSRTIRWSEVQAIQRSWPGGKGLKGYRLRLQGPNGPIVIYESTFARPDSLVAFVHRHTPAVPITEP